MKKLLKLSFSGVFSSFLCKILCKYICPHAGFLVLSKSVRIILIDLTVWKIGPYPYEYKKMNPCEYCEYGSVCGFDLQLEGCHYRRLSALDKDEVWQEIAREENKQTDKEEREDG